jgi:hypothetical protein
MNERIQELATQAGMVMYPTGLGISENTLWGDRNIGKFAELLIKECANIAYNTQYKHSPAHIRGDCSDQIKQHFDVGGKID